MTNRLVDSRDLDLITHPLSELLRTSLLLLGQGWRDHDDADLPPNRRHVHTMRHSMATHLLDAGEPINFLQDQLGHRNIESSLVYARVSDRRRSKTISRLERSREIAAPI